MTIYTFLIAVLVAPALFCTLSGAIRFPLRSEDNALIAQRRWAHMRKSSSVLVISWLAYGITIWSLIPGRFSLPPFLFDGILLKSVTLFKFANFLFLSIISSLALVPLAAAYILYLFAVAWCERRIRREFFSLRGVVRLMLFEAIHRLLPYALILLFVVSGATPWIILGRNIVQFNMPIALFILTACSLLYFNAFRISQAFLGVIAPAKDSALEQRAAELSTMAGVKPGRLFRLKTFGYPYAQGYALRNGDICLSDRVIEGFIPAERDAVLAHEIGHLMHMKGLITKHFAAYAAWILVPFFILPLGDIYLSDGLTVFLFRFTLIYGCLLLMKLTNKISRSHELEADKFSASVVGDETFIRAMERLHEINLLPHRFDNKGRENLSHPSLDLRTDAVRRSAGTPVGGKASPE